MQLVCIRYAIQPPKTFHSNGKNDPHTQQPTAFLAEYFVELPRKITGLFVIP